jgi:hypothetical protein
MLAAVRAFTAAPADSSVLISLPQATPPRTAGVPDLLESPPPPPPLPGPQVSIALSPQRDVAITLLAKVLVGQRGSPSYHVLELEVELPKYTCYAAMDKAR